MKYSHLRKTFRTHYVRIGALNWIYQSGYLIHELHEMVKNDKLLHVLHKSNYTEKEPFASSVTLI